VKSYAQYCGLARALDLVGDRWTLLVVRELLVGPARYAELRDGLPGIATNLLAQRLRSLEAGGLVVRRTLAPPAASTVYELTEAGRRLEPAVLALTRWGGAQLVDGPRRGDTFRPQWLVLALRSLLPARAPRTPRTAVAFVVPGARVVVRGGDGTLSVTLDDATDVDASVSGDPAAILGVVSGELELRDARAAGRIEVTGSRRVVREMVSAFSG
jgi:DNA-binding HxlR family transcriptional regulator